MDDLLVTTFAVIGAGQGLAVARRFGAKGTPLPMRNLRNAPRLTHPTDTKSAIPNTQHFTDKAAFSSGGASSRRTTAAALVSDGAQTGA
ncbi:hypothetical protein [Pseudarthrobacter albicanus]|uniref:hypothetical protein n=1 Tax=Pseudarthrobacter albicanus TaxID=2823873 RepID=UPI001BA4C3EB|nr:hypothetical protein [Pseudarthrobacter albicanus]